MRADALKRLWSNPEGMIFVIRRVLTEYGARHWRRYAASLALGGIAGGCTSAVAYSIGHVINQAYVYRSTPGIVSLCAVVIAIFVTKGFALYGQAVTLAYAGNQIAAETQWRIFEKFLHENLAYFANRHSSEFMARAAFAAGAPAGVLTLLVNTIGRDFVTLVGLITVMVIQDPLLSLVTMLVAPPAVIFVRGLVKQARALAYTQYLNSAAILEAVQETVQGLRIIKAFNLENGMLRRVGDSITAVQRAGNEMSRLTNRTGPFMESLGGIAVAIVLAYGGYRVVATGATPGAFFSFTVAFLLAYEPAKRLTQINLTLNNSLIGVKVLFEVLDTPDTEPDDNDKPALRLENGRIEFIDVEFAYRPGEPVLRGISFVAAPGQVTALVGPSGGGKSTIFSLLLRFYGVNHGVIAIDGQDISAVARQSVRGQIGYVGQDVFLFKGTIRENIALGAPNASEQQIIDAAKAALAHEFIMTFPRGYDTPVGELGAQLSTGQRQRVAIARALLKDAKLILLDEPTSALDSESERKVAEAVARLCEGRTTMVIAHRLHTIVHADCIHVVENGTIVETGRHDDLMRRRGRYAQLYNTQFKYWTAEAILSDADQIRQLVGT
jgi:ABC-type multidrug transport system fused ATPase/permease subunit